MEEPAIRGFVQKEIMKNRGSLEVTDNLIEQGIIDSLGIVKMIDYLETTFQIRVSDEEVLPANFETIESMCTFVRRKQGKNIRREKQEAYITRGESPAL